MIMHLQYLNLSKDEKERVAALHQTYGFIVYNAGFSCTMEEGRKVEMCYWRCLRGVRESALFPNHEAAWRDALRVHEEAVDAVKANPGVHRVKSAGWNGVGQPPVGTTLWVIPHNTFWGFPEVGTYLCEVLAYRDEYVWLELLSDIGGVVLGKYITTRIDKVDVKVWKGNNDD